MYSPQAEEIEVVWEPIPGTSQELALDCRCNWTLFHGTRGPGKTITQAMYYRQYVGLGYGSFWKGVIFDREFKNLSDLVAQTKRVFPLFNDGCKFKSSASEFKWVWPTGEELLFRHVKKITDYDGFHGHEYPFIGWNELTKHPTSELYDKMMSTNRCSFSPKKHTPKEKDELGRTVLDQNGRELYATPDGKPLPEIPLRVFSTTNSNGPGHNWVKKRFINCADPGEVIEIKSVVFDPKIQKEREVVLTQIAIFGSYRENIYLSAEYIAELNRLTDNDPNLKAAWVHGSWDVVSGGALDDLWSADIHIIPRFPIPKGWRINRSLDWGSSHPFSVGWWAESNGEEIRLPDGRIFCPPRGTLVQIDELYGTEEIGTNKGVKMAAPDLALKILQKEEALINGNWIEETPNGGPADNQISDVREVDVDTIETKMANEGVRWTKSVKSKGSRVIGLELLRNRLLASRRGEGVGIYFMRNCKGSIETLPILQRDEDDLDDIDTTSEDHPYDMIRYRIMKVGDKLAHSLKFKTGL